MCIRSLGARFISDPHTGRESFRPTPDPGAEMDVTLWRRSGHKTTIRNVSSQESDRIFNSQKKILDHPCTTFYRITAEDPLAGGRVVRDSDLEWLDRMPS